MTDFIRDPVGFLRYNADYDLVDGLHHYYYDGVSD